MMTEHLYPEQVLLEEEARGLTVQRFHKDHLRASEGDTFSETMIGSYVLTNYLIPFQKGLEEWLVQVNTGKAGRRNLAAKLLDDMDAPTVSFLFLKALINRLGLYTRNRPRTYTAVAIYIGDLIHDERRLRAFEFEHTKLSKKIHADFAKRELLRDKRVEYMRRVFAGQGMEWSEWSTSERLHLGSALLAIFQEVTGDLVVATRGKGKAKKNILSPSEGLMKAIDSAMLGCEGLMTVYMPTIIEPVDWSKDNLTYGGYFSENITPYPLVKKSKKGYQRLLEQKAHGGELERVFDAVNAIQKTPWTINTRVLETLQYIYNNNIECGKLPKADVVIPEGPPPELQGWTRETFKVANLDADDPIQKSWNAYQQYRARIHEGNRRVIGKRIMAQRSFHLAEKFSKYPAIYFPHDMDSRGRLYPKPSALNPQGPDYVKALLQFAEGKPLGPTGVEWLAVHGANCWGEDKLPLHERAEWAFSHIHLARSVAQDPRQNLEWTKADNPSQFLAWCFEWASAHSLDDPTEFVSHLHVDLDATCSGLQHFSAMLRDEVGGFHVNMLPDDARQDVYGAVATEAVRLLEEDLGTERDGLARAWLKFGINRKTTKRSVMVKPYSGTRTSCNAYVAEAVDDRLSSGEPMPWPKDDLWAFKVYGAEKVWNAIPKVVVAADGAMRWLSTIARMVGKTNGEEKRIEWTTPLGLPVWQYKFNLKSRCINTFFEGKRIQPRLTETTDKLDSRQMGTSVAPSFVHSLDACHLMATISAAWNEGMEHFAVVHDSFGVHAADCQQFTSIIREEFVWMYTEHDVLSEFLETAKPHISEKFLEDIPPIPETGNLDMDGVLSNQFFFS